MRVYPLGREDSLQEGTATHSSVLAWSSCLGQRSLVGYVHGVARVRHDRSDLARTHTRGPFSSLQVCNFTAVPHLHPVGEETGAQEAEGNALALFWKLCFHVAAFSCGCPSLSPRAVSFLHSLQ